MATREWKIPHGAVQRHVTVERAENGKDVIRVDGRVASQPLAPAEQEREFLVGRATYLLRRTPDGGFDLDLVAAARTDDVFTQAKMAEAKLTVGPLETLMGVIKLNRILWAGLAVVVLVIMMWAVGPGYEKQAEERVELLLAEMSHGPGPMEDLAIGIWARNARTLDTMELSWAAGAFPRFRKEQGLNRKFATWKVIDSEVVEGATVPTAIVSIEVDGKPLKMVVPERKPIEWAD